MKRRLHFFLLLAIISCAAALSGPLALAAPTLDEVFANPPQQAKPRVMWMWMGRNVTTEGITRDLEALKDAGFGGAMMFALSDVCTPWAASIGNSPEPDVVAFTDPWWKLVRHAAAESKRLGLDFGMGNCPGYETSGGKWITPELSMQEVVFSKVRVEGGKRAKLALPRPMVDPRANQPFPVIHPETGAVEPPIIEDRKTFYRDIAVLAVPAEGTVGKDAAIDLTKMMDAEGNLDWDAPLGNWEIIRCGHTTKGKQIQPSQWAAMGHECDKMNPEAVEFHMKHVIGKLREHLGDLIGCPGLTNLHFDSYEAGEPSWTPRMREEFKARRGYDPLAWLPVLAGREVGSAAESAKFRADFKQTIADLYRDVYYPTLKRMCNEAGLDLSSEPYGGPWHIPEIVPQLDRVLTEFWATDKEMTLYQGDELMGAAWKHNTPVIEAEAFTGAPEMSKWTETPGSIKRMGDAAFCLGVNRMMLHMFPQQPWPGVKPGVVMGQWGTHFSQNQTWWEPGKAWVAYLARTQAVLQWGEIRPLQAGDFNGPEGIKSIRRAAEGADVFFVANLTTRGVNGNLTFAVAGRQPELWDPVRATQRDLTDFIQTDGKTTLPLEFAPSQSFLVVFRKPTTTPPASKTPNAPSCSASMEIAGSWKVRFDPKMGGPAAPQEFATLQDWTASSDPAIRYFSGTASYFKSFDVPAAALAATELDLGAVNHLARVKLNGQDLGVVWTAPWRAAIPAGLLKEKDNQLVIEVTNVWANRLIGDEQHPDDCEWTPGPRGNGKFLKRFPDWFVKRQARPSSGRIAFTTWNYFNKDSKPVPSGLLGPVCLMMADGKQGSSAVKAEQAVRPGREDAFEAELPSAVLRIKPAGIVETGASSGQEGVVDVNALFNGTTRNGNGGAETLNDGKTYRTYGAGHSLLLKLPGKDGARLGEIQTFAGHRDGRSSQAYSVWIAKADAPGLFIEVAEAKADSQGGSSRLRVPLDARNVVAVRIDFADGPLGVNVYREICLLTSASSAGSNTKSAPISNLDGCNVVWDTPSANGSFDSMPLGNGDIGLNVWVESNGDLMFYVSKVDAFDSQHLLPKLGRVRLRTEPALDITKVKTSLLLEQAAVEVVAGDARFRVWVDANAPVIRVQGHSPTPRKVSIAAESLRQWQNAADPAPGSGTAALLFHDNTDKVAWCYRNQSSAWAGNFANQNSPEMVAKTKDPILHRTSGCVLSANGFKRLNPTTLATPQAVSGIDATVRVLTNQPDSPDAWKNEASKPVKSDWNAHLAYWKAFWNRSHIFIPKAGEGTYNLDQYRFMQFAQARDVYQGHKEIQAAQNAYQITQRYALERFCEAIASRGAVPPQYNGSLFTMDMPAGVMGFDRPKGNPISPDGRDWAQLSFMWQNTRHPYWAMPSRGDYDTILPGMRFVRDGLNIARDRCQKLYGIDGAVIFEASWYHNVCVFPFEGMPGHLRFHQLATVEVPAIMAETYAHTRNERFLREILLPCAEEGLKFYFNRFPNTDARGKMLMEGVGCAETYQGVTNPATEIGCMKYLLDQLLSFPIDPPHRATFAKWRARLPDVPTRRIRGMDLLAVGEVYQPGRVDCETPELYSIYPFRQATIATPEKLAMARQSFHVRNASLDGTVDWQPVETGGWQSAPVQAAYLGLAREAARLASINFNDRFAHWSGNLAKSPDGELMRAACDGPGFVVGDPKSGLPFPYRPRAKFPAFWETKMDGTPDNDHGANSANTLQAMLLQSHGESIHLLPAWPEDWDVSFKLTAARNTTVECVYQNGRVTSLKVTPEGRRKDIVDHSTPEARIRTLTEIACADRNWLFNLPPMLDGLPTPGPVTGPWIGKFGESVTNTRGTFWPGCTFRDNLLYVHGKNPVPEISAKVVKQTALSDTLVRVEFDQALEAIVRAGVSEGALTVGKSGTSLDLGKPKTFDRLEFTIENPNYQRGQAKAFRLEVLQPDGQWSVAHQGNIYGIIYSKRFPPVTASQVRLVIDAPVTRFDLFTPGF
ncbi:MAG: hypothetical protein J0M04_23495 [Verrucomicrobia bacterium]|nr:hypothetical protein [Verrucomicrobiota bacterium]